MAVIKNSRSTQAKQSVLALIEGANVALSHADIEEALNGKCNRVTIYRVLDRLLEDDKIHKLVDMDGVNKYMACVACNDDHLHHHLHFSCEQCEQVSCLHHVIPSFQLPEGYSMHELNFTVRGICADCAVTSL
ncbi:MAG: transcriptional repressor [Chitinophagales bacterium]